MNFFLSLPYFVLAVTVCVSGTFAMHNFAWRLSTPGGVLNSEQCFWRLLTVHRPPLVIYFSRTVT